jgi:hypothetical protein
MDAGEYEIQFAQHVTSGAVLPVYCDIDLSEASGNVLHYEEIDHPVVVDTRPAVSAASAAAIGKAWVRQNFSENLSASARLRVQDDPVLDQVLVYNLDYDAASVDVDAQTGDILSATTVDTAPKSAPDTQVFIDTMLSCAQNPLNRSAIRTQGHVFLWSGYLKLIGFTTTPAPGQITLICGRNSVILPILDVATTNAGFAWQRKSGVYVALDQVVAMTDNAHLDDAGQHLIFEVAANTVLQGLK